MAKEYILPQGTGTKKAGKKERLTLNQAEVYNQCFKDYNGLLFFAENCCWVRLNGLVKYKPFDYQRKALFNMFNYKDIINLWGRQEGKTITSSIFCLWYAMAHPNKDILLTSYNLRASAEILYDVKVLYENCPNFLKPGIEDYNVTSIEFSNGSRIFSRPTTINAPRGLTPAIIYCDEFAFISQAKISGDKIRKMQEEFYAAISPALSSSKGKLFITSTPLSETDMFYELWAGATSKCDLVGNLLPKHYVFKIDGEMYRDLHLFKTKEEAEIELEKLGNPVNYNIAEIDPPGYNGFQSHMVKWNDCPLKTPEWAEKELIKLGETKFKREYECLTGENLVTIKDKQGKIFNCSLESLYNFHMA